MTRFRNGSSTSCGNLNCRLMLLAATTAAVMTRTVFSFTVPFRSTSAAWSAPSTTRPCNIKNIIHNHGLGHCTINDAVLRTALNAAKKENKVNQDEEDANADDDDVSASVSAASDLNEEPATAMKSIVKCSLYTKELLDSISLNYDELIRFKNGVDKCLEADLEKAEDRRLTNLQGKAEDRLERLTKRANRDPLPADVRIAPIDYEIEHSEFEFRHDYEAFEKRIEELFAWFKPANKRKYRAPYFPIIQSSGMGKTKLLHEYQKNHPLTTRLVLCKISTTDTEATPSIYTDHFELGKGPFTNENAYTQERIQITDTLNAIVANIINAEKQLSVGVGKRAIKKKQPIVLLFDEAQKLLRLEGFAFRCIRWWLCMEQREHDRQVVAVFTGTSSKLSNFFRDFGFAQYSRDAGNFYNLATGLYEPFYEFCTIGLFKNKKVDTAEQESNDLIRAAKYGRPLFACMASKGDLTDDVLKSIRKRLCLGETNVGTDIVDVAGNVIVGDIDDATDEEGDWSGNKGKLSDKAYINILATRVAMGQVSVDVASDLIAGAYANLAHFYSTGKVKVASICYHPDPVCAHAAMELMTSTDDDTQKTVLWANKASYIFSTGLCQPEKGGLGEIAAALYLLQCGDVLRKVIDPTLKHFSVPLLRWMLLLADPKDILSENISPVTKEPCVSFIQICRNSLRHSLGDLVNGQFLREWFEAGLAFYAYPGCPVYDIIAPVRYVGENDVVKYCPMVISVKNRLEYSAQNIANASETLEELLRNHTDVGIGVLLLTGMKNPRSNTEDIKVLTTKLATQHINLEKVGIWSIVIAVPQDDCFGVWDFAVRTTAAGGDRVEVFDSQFLVHQSATEFTTPANQTRLLRATNSSSARRLLSGLIEAYQKLQPDVTKDSSA